MKYSLKCFVKEILVLLIEIVRGCLNHLLILIKMYHYYENNLNDKKYRDRSDDRNFLGVA